MSWQVQAHRGGSSRVRTRCRRPVRLLALGTTAALAAAALAAAGGGTAGAAAPRAQSVGRFVDGELGNTTTLESIADLEDARAQAAPNTTSRNPLDLALLKTIDIPFGNALKLPGGNVLALGAANQIAVANSDGSAYGSSGAVSTTGGAELTDDSAAYPSFADLDLSTGVLGAAGLPGLPGLGSLPTIPVGSGVPGLPALGGVALQVGAVSALAATATGGKAQRPQYNIAGLTLTLQSPALAALLRTLAGQLGGSSLNGILGTVALGGGALPAACTFTSAGLGSTLTLDGGAVVVDAATGSLMIDLAKLLTELKLNLNALPANTDLIDYLIRYLTSVTGLTAGIEAVIGGLTTPLEAKFTACATALGATNTGLGTDVLAMLNTALSTGRTTFEAAVNRLLGSASGLPGATGDPLAPLGTGLKQVIDIGVNVESGPGKAADNTEFRYSSGLHATPDQDTAVVAGQTLVRAIEIKLGGGALATLALANAAAGPSTLTTPVTTPPVAPPVPTGVAAGRAVVDDSGSTLPALLALLALVLAGGGALTAWVRGRHVR